MRKGQLRIVAGRFGGRRLLSAPGTRPTEERVREAIFARLSAEVEGARVLDLYAGSGALGLEALSRGARRVVLVERDARAAAVIEVNLAALGAADEVWCLKLAARRAPTVLAEHGEVFDLVLADPPYEESSGLEEQTAVAEAVQALAGLGCLAPDAVVAVEHRRREGGSACWRGFETEAVREYGDTHVTYFRYLGGSRQEGAGNQEGASTPESAEE
jgi:16S rRNA (guanine966-N2)-methyltransferase